MPNRIEYWFKKSKMLKVFTVKNFHCYCSIATSTSTWLACRCSFLDDHLWLDTASYGMPKNHLGKTCVKEYLRQQILASITLFSFFFPVLSVKQRCGGEGSCGKHIS